MATQNWSVKGLTCGHCEMSIKNALGAADGITGVSIELHPNEVSQITTESTRDLTSLEIQDLLSDAGNYDLV